MPILPAEPDMYPPDLWQKEVGESDQERRWWCLHVKPRQEKATARHLRNRSIAHYLPLVIREGRTPGGRRIRSTVPLFTGYVFLRGDERQRVEALKGNTLAGMLEVFDQEALTCDLRQIHQMLNSGLPIEPEAAHPVGARVRIVSGPLAGVEGMVIRRGKCDRFVAVVRFLKCGATVDLADWQVERVDD